MNVFFFFLLVSLRLCAAHVTDKPLFVPGIPLHRSANKSDINKSSYSAVCDGMRFAYCQDCRTLVVCAGTHEASVRLCDRSTPFCIDTFITAKCSDNFDLQSEDCLPNVEDFLCTDSGYFPDPHFCQIYHICDAAFGTSVSYTCPTEYVFHGPTRHCMLQTSPSDCITMSHNCEENDRVWAKYDEESDFFAFCPGNSILQNGFDDIIMYRCEEGHLFDGLHCISDGNLPSPPGPPGPPGPPSPPGTTPPSVPPGEINCPHVGRFPFPNDPTRFIVCFTNSQGIMNYMIRPCAPNFIFNPDIQLCERVPSRIKGYIE